MKHTIEEVQAKILEFRRDYHAGRLSAYQIEQLEAIPGWTWDVDTPIPEPKTPLASHDLVAADGSTATGLTEDEVIARCQAVVWSCGRR